MALGTGLTNTQVRVNFRHLRRRPASWEFPLDEGLTEEVPRPRRSDQAAPINDRASAGPTTRS